MFFEALQQLIEIGEDAGHSVWNAIIFAFDVVLMIWAIILLAKQ